LSYTLTVRHGPSVRREGFDALDDALAALERHADEVRAEGPLGSVSAFREYGADRRVAARLQLSVGGWLRGREAGIDVMGDGTLVPYTGAIRRRQLDPGAGQSPFDAVREALR
jgi:hypothetical protein